jgi:ubiquinone/menaquinone biosynthesis C-methylase UbiE
MPKIIPFQKYASRYEKWFEENRGVYQAELNAIRSLVPAGQYGMEIGVGTGRFAEPLGVKVGVDPSSRMRKFARKRGIKVLSGVAEKLPFKDSLFEFVLMVTTICFVDDIDKAFKETFRVLLKGGYLIIGLIDRNSPVGQTYLKLQNKNVFYKEATFYSVNDVLGILKQTGFKDFSFRQTIFRNLSEITDHETVKSGYGEGSFIVIRSKKK